MTPATIWWLQGMNLRVQDEQEQLMPCHTCGKKTIHKLLYAAREWSCTICGTVYRGPRK